MQEMEYEERELIKRIATKSNDETKTTLLVLIAHWHRQPKAVAFTEYAAHWIWSTDNRGMDNGFYIDELKQHFDKPDVLRISKNGSDYR